VFREELFDSQPGILGIGRVWLGRCNVIEGLTLAGSQRLEG
jgi:hypothetical protein